MKAIKTTTLYVFLCLFLVTNSVFATDDDEEEPGTGTRVEIAQIITEEECGFFCTIGEWIKDLF